MKYFFIADNYDKILDERQKAFLKLLIGQKASDDFSRKIELLTEDAKHNTQWKKQYMEWERQRTYDFENDKEAKAKEAAIAFLKEGDSPEKIARCLNMPIEDVLSLKQELSNED